MSRADFRFSVSIRFRWPFGRRRFEFGNVKKRRRPEPLVAIPAQPSGWDPVEPAPPWFAETLRRHRDGTVYYVEPVPSAVGVASVPVPGAPAATKVIPAVREELDLDPATKPEGYLEGYARGLSGAPSTPVADDYTRGMVSGALDRERAVGEDEEPDEGEGNSGGFPGAGRPDDRGPTL